MSKLWRLYEVSSFLLFLIAMGLMAHSEELGSSMQSVIVENPTLDGYSFAANDNSMAYICDLKGYNISEELETKSMQIGTLVIHAYRLGTGPLPSDGPVGFYKITRLKWDHFNGQPV